MIIVCELQQKGIDHERVNSGFIYGLRIAYPKEVITFFSDTSHFQKIKDIFNANKIPFKSIKHFPVSFDVSKRYSIWGIINYYFLTKKVFDKSLSLGVNKVFFLSVSPIILYVIKKLKRNSKYKNVCCTFVLHGELEDIANKDYIEPYKPVIIGAKINSTRVIKTLLNHPDWVLLFVIRKILWPILTLNSYYSLVFKRKFRTKVMMMWKHSGQYKYISLSPHVTKNASKYLNTRYLNFRTIMLPIIFTRPYPQPDNNGIKFAVFGFGDSAQMYKMLSLLSKKRIDKPYEIRIISMDDRGTDGFKSITHVGNGSVLTRKEMENSTHDIDMFINLHDKSRHSLGCSLSIFEAFSYLKPVLHLSNPGYNYFNKSRKPIGFRCENLDEFVNKMCELINNYPLNKKQLAVFRKNMLEYRKKYAIENNLSKLKESFTFPKNI
jgi:hypothetical protein